MARPHSQLNQGVLLLDSEGLSKAVAADPQVTAFIRAAQSNDILVAVSDLTLIEAWHGKVRMDRFRWYVSRLQVLPVTEAITWSAIDLLRDAGLHGHKYAIDAVVAATALSYRGPRIILTSDSDDMLRLCGGRVRVEGV
ncbi:type II toxin-antitoxin system VapC family toxin [Streptomyces pratensis]|uniref:type II toxin-antitoxin system VapC family toxin n=1 Tax=Streptomyces pratensis TaxID=1169025 RepID=UPI001934004E|nr:PIN domain-containing protein [Streptomyces pratensis]